MQQNVRMAMGETARSPRLALVIEYKSSHDRNPKPKVLQTMQTTRQVPFLKDYASRLSCSFYCCLACKESLDPESTSGGPSMSRPSPPPATSAGYNALVLLSNVYPQMLIISSSSATTDFSSSNHDAVQVYLRQVDPNGDFFVGGKSERQAHLSRLHHQIQKVDRVLNVSQKPDRQSKL